MSLLNDLLDISRLEAGKAVYEMEPTDLYLAVHDAVQDFQSVLNEKSLTVTLPDPQCNHEVICDAYKMGQVFRNLLSNAIKYSNTGGSIDIRFRESAIPFAGKVAPALEISFSDRGIGIPENELDAIFDKFIQSSRTKTGAGGTGLGLAICKEIVEAHHGMIAARNNPGGGATFFLTIPYQP